MFWDTSLVCSLKTPAIAADHHSKMPRYLAA